MNQFVLDSSVTMAWCFEDEKTAYSETILERLGSGDQAIVPPLWSYEVLNVLVGAQRHKRITQAQAINFWNKLQFFPIIIDSANRENSFLDILSLAHQYHLTGYDAAYLELCLRTGSPLASLDENLRNAAQRAGVRTAGKP